MKKIVLFLLWMGLCFAKEDLNEQEKLDAQIQSLKEEIRSFGIRPQSEILKEKSQLKQKEFYKKNGFFLGILGGLVHLNHAYHDGKYNTEHHVEGATNTGVLLADFRSNALLLLFGGKVGYQNFFNQYFGVRLYGDALLGSGKMKKDKKNIGTNSYVLGALNVDLLYEYALNPIFDLGAFMGFGIGLMLLGDEAKDVRDILLHQNFSSPDIFWRHLLGIDYAINLGMSVAYLKKHRFEFGVKIPLTSLRIGLEKSAVYQDEIEQRALLSQDIDFSRSTSFVMSYIYVF